MDHLWWIVIFVAIALLGFVSFIRARHRLTARIELAYEFNAKLNSYAESQGRDRDAYAWLVHRSSKVQTQLGEMGLMTFKPPFANFQYRNYPVVLNFLPQLRREFESDFSPRGHADYYCTTMQECLIRYSGALEDASNVFMRSLRNPADWLREGARVLLAIPFSTLAWTGLLSQEVVAGMTKAKTFGVVSAVAALIGFTSAVIDITLGWEQFATTTTNLWAKVSP